ncbi:MAG: hypothetical protein RL728_904 [Bacteroidota bacterium]|jgi:hypothetical protein
MKNTIDYVNNTELEFDTEANRSYYEARIAETINDVKKDVIDEIMSLYVPDGNPTVWLDKIKMLRDGIS